MLESKRLHKQAVREKEKYRDDQVEVGYLRDQSAARATLDVLALTFELPDRLFPN